MPFWPFKKKYSEVKKNEYIMKFTLVDGNLNITFLGPEENDPNMIKNIGNMFGIFVTGEHIELIFDVLTQYLQVVGNKEDFEKISKVIENRVAIYNNQKDEDGNSSDDPIISPLDPIGKRLGIN